MPSANAQADPGNRKVAWANRRRIFRLPRRADQQPGVVRVPLPRRGPCGTGRNQKPTDPETARDKILELWPIGLYPPIS